MLSACSETKNCPPTVCKHSFLLLSTCIWPCFVFLTVYLLKLTNIHFALGLCSQQPFRGKNHAAEQPSVGLRSASGSGMWCIISQHFTGSYDDHACDYHQNAFDITCACHCYILHVFAIYCITSRLYIYGCNIVLLNDF